MTDRLRDICRDLDIEIIEVHQTRGPGQTCAVQTLQRILDERGEGHFVMVMRTIMESENNKYELVAPTMWAVSDTILNHPTWADTGLAWLEFFDTVDLAELARLAKQNKKTVPARRAIATMIFERAVKVFGEDKQKDLFR